jgi:hypothetical protein
MQVNRFEMEPKGPAERRTEPRPEDRPAPTLRASDSGDGEDQRRDETIEEPGYGHGV